MSARLVQATYLIRVRAKESIKHYQLLLTRSYATREFANLKCFDKQAKWFQKMISCFCFLVNLEPYQTHIKFVHTKCTVNLEIKGRHIKFMHTSRGNRAVTATDMWVKLNIYTTKNSSSSSSTNTSTTNYSGERPHSFSASSFLRKLTSLDIILLSCL
jgi:hypothetical protein